MKERLIKVIIGVFAVLPFIAASCMMNDKDDIPDFGEQLQKDLAAIDEYLAAKGIDAEQDPDGFIRYVIHHDSIGDNKPTLDSCVTANYQGKLLANEQEFDKGINVSFPIYGVIDGWKIGIPLLSLGDSATLYIPSGLGYGYYGFDPDIPSNANLIFHVGVKNVGETYKASSTGDSCD